MIKYLHFWALGSIMLLLMTASTTLQTLFSILLLIGEPSWMMAPKWMRYSVFFQSLMSVGSFIGQFVWLTVYYFKGRNPF